MRPYQKLLKPACKCWLFYCLFLYHYAAIQLFLPYSDQTNSTINMKIFKELDNGEFLDRNPWFSWLASVLLIGALAAYAFFRDLNVW